MRINRVSVLATAAMLSLSLTGCGVIGSQSDKSTLVIGADLELSGADAAAGIAYRQALDLEISQINAAGGAGGHPLRLDALDNHSDPHVSVTNIATLSDEPNLAAIVTGACADCLGAVQKTLNDKKIPTISLAPTDLPTELKYLFKLNPNAEDDADRIATELQGNTQNGGTQDDAVDKFAIVTTNDDYGGRLASAITTQADKRHAVTVLTAKIQPTGNTAPSLHTTVAEAISKDPQALVIAAPPDQAAAVAVAVRELKFSGPMYFDAIAAGNLFQPSATAAATDGVRMVAPQSLVIDDIIATSPAQTARKQWLNAYTSKYSSFSAYSLYAADAAQVIAAAITSTNGADHDRLRSTIESTQMDGFSGPLRFTPNNHSGLTPQALTTLTMDDGRWHLAAG